MNEYEKGVIMKKTIQMIAVFALLSLSFSVYAADGKVLYKKCSACHGEDGSKKALGTGHPLKGQTAEDLLKKMKGYQDGSYGGKKAAIMKRNLSKLTDEDLKALAEYIATF